MPLRHTIFGAGITACYLSWGFGVPLASARMFRILCRRGLAQAISIAYAANPLQLQAIRYDGFLNTKTCPATPNLPPAQ